MKTEDTVLSNEIRPSLFNQFVTGLLFGLAGFALNWFKLELFFDVGFIFGSIITMFALLRYGLLTGVLAAFIASLCTIYHWHQPWGVVVFTVEALFTSLWYRRKDSNAVLGNLTFWCTFGIVLVLIFYQGVMGFTIQASLLIGVKQGVNGVLNTLLGSTIYFAYRYNNSDDNKLPSLRDFIFVTISLSVVIPIFFLMYLDIRSDFKTELLDRQDDTAMTAKSVQQNLQLWLSSKDPFKPLSTQELGEVQKLISNSVQVHSSEILVLDNKEMIVASTTSPELVGRPYKFKNDGHFIEVKDRVMQWIPDQKSGVGAAKRWYSSFYLATLPIETAAGWRIVVIKSLKETLEIIGKKSSIDMSVIALLMFILLILSRQFSFKIGGMIYAFQNLTKTIPEKIATGEDIILPDVSTKELYALKSNIREMCRLLQGAREELINTNQILEVRVEERTEELRSSRDMWEKTFNSIPDIITILDLNHNILHANRSMIDAMEKYVNGCAVGLPCYKVVHSLDAPPPYCPHSKLLLDGKEHQEEIYEPVLDKHLLVTVTPTFDSNMKLTGSIHVARDISELKNKEDILRVAKESAERATVAKSQFLSTMSHEIRTPMNGVLGMTSMLLSTKLDEKQREYTEIIKQSGQQLLNIINDVLDFSKIEAGMVEILYEPLEVRQIIADCVRNINVLALEKGLILEQLVTPTVPKSVCGDQLRLRQVIFNLLGNGIKFTHTGSVSIHAGVLSESADSITLTFTVSDSGIGIPEDKLEHIFDTFTQVDSSTTRKYGGTGLGLSICRQLVHLMGGEIGVTSKEGKGSSFWFTVKFRYEQKKIVDELKDASHLPQLSEETDISTLKENLVLNGAKILLAEDDPVNQIVARAFLNKLGYSFDIASDGLVALKMLSQNDYTLVLMDCMMPNMGGFEATANIRNPDSNVRNHEIPIIAMTANVSDSDRKNCLEAGMNDYIGKPFDIKDLSEVLDKWGGHQK